MATVLESEELSGLRALDGIEKNLSLIARREQVVDSLKNIERHIELHTPEIELHNFGPKLSRRRV